MDRDAIILMFEGLKHLTDVAMPFMAFLFGMVLGVTTLLLGARWLLRHTENAVTGLALRLEDTRKKKRDEYDAYYDARLAESPEPDTNIAYYEDDTGHRTTHK